MSTHLRAMAAGAALLLAVGGCDSKAPSPSPTTTPSAATSPSTPIATAQPVATPVATIAWLAPAGSSVTTSVATFTVTTSAPDVRRFEFELKFGSRHVAACVAARPSAEGDWSCKADLFKLGVPPGRISVTATAFDTAERVLSGLSGSRSISYEVAPPKPAGTTFKVTSTKEQPDGSAIEVDRITWKAPAGYAREFRLYGVRACPNDGPLHDGEPCLVEHMSLDSADLHLIKKVDGTERSIVLRNTIPEGECGGGLWCTDDYALVLGAFNAYGHSVYAIATSATVCYQCVY